MITTVISFATPVNPQLWVPLVDSMAVHRKWEASDEERRDGSH